MTYRKNKHAIVGLILASLFFPCVSFAQLSTTVLSDPQNPGAYEKVTLTLKTYSFDVDVTKIDWYVDGKIAKSGIGEKNFETNTGGVGSNKIVRVVATGNNGKSLFETSLSLAPQSVGLVWESKESYVPPFYEGKALPGESSTVTVTALPTFAGTSGQVIDAKDIAYSWYMNDKFITSGYGKQSVDLTLDYLSNQNDIKVIARSTDGGIAENTITVYPHDIIPIFYIKDPIYGLNLSQSIENRFETTKEFTLGFSPYYLSLRNGLEPSVSYNWSLNGLPVTPESNLSITLAPKGNTNGSKTLAIAIENTDRLLQEITARLEIVFDTR